jgi:hypothetical protein
MKRNRIAFIVFLAALSALSAVAQQDIETVKLAFARLSFATQAYAVDNAVSRNPKISYDQLKKAVADTAAFYEIHVLSSGNIAEIADVPFSSLVSRPAGEDEISISMVTAGYRINNGPEKSSFEALARWAPGRSAQDMGPGGMMSFGAVMKLIEDHDLKVPPEKQALRYVSMSVTETMASRSVSRKTVMTFDKDGDMQFVGQAGVEFFAKNSPYPGKLLEVDQRSPAVERWFTEHAVQAETGDGDLICDLEALTCGVASGDLKRIPILKLPSGM